MAERTMKNSGIDWIREIPSSWDIYKVKKAFDRKDAKAKQDDPVVLSLARDGVKIRNISNNEGQLAESYYNYNPVEPGDLLLNPMDLYSGANCSLSKVSGVISPAYMNLRAKTGFDPRFYDYFFKTQYWGMALFAHGKGVSFDNRWTLGKETLMNYFIPHPSYKEQVRIADFLDKKVSEIDAIISKTKESIEEYKKLKQSIITEAVTKGLDPNVEMKDSGNKFVGLIPKHWEIKRTRFIADSLGKGNGITKEEVYPDGDISCVRYGEIYTKYNGAFTSCVSRTKLEQIVKPSYFSYGDLLLCGTGELVEEIGKNIVYLGDEKCLAGGDIIIMKHKQNPTFINYALNSSYSQTQKSYGKSKLKVVHISAAEIGDVWIALPPIGEQKAIGEYLDVKCSGFDSLISRKEQVITELEQYKKSMIYEYVTGKKETPNDK